MASHPIGKMVWSPRGVLLHRIAITQIVPDTAGGPLDSQRLRLLERGFDTFETIINDPHWRGDPIALERMGARFSINNGRHRVYLANAKGLVAVWAQIV